MTSLRAPRRLAKILSAVLSSAPPCTLADLQNPLDPGSDSPGPSPQRQSCATCRSSIIAILKLATSLSLLGGSRCFTQELKHFYTAQGVECSSATCHSWLSLASLEAQFPDDFLSSGVATAVWHCLQRRSKHLRAEAGTGITRASVRDAIRRSTWASASTRMRCRRWNTSC